MLARHLADILKPLLCKKSTHIQNSKDLGDKLEHIELEERGGGVLSLFDDTGVVSKKEYADEQFQHINQLHNSIKFTIEQEDEENNLLMLDYTND